MLSPTRSTLPGRAVARRGARAARARAAALAASALAALAGAALAGTATAGAAGGGARAGAIAPAGRWTVAGGAASRSGAAATAPLRGPVEVAWSHEAGGTIEGEPLVWDDRVVLVVVPRPGQRAVRVLDLRSGEPLVPERVVRSASPLAPTAWGRTLVVRSGERELTAFHVGRARLHGDWTWHADAPVGEPLLFGDELYVATSSALVRAAIGRSEPVWRVEGRFLGPLVLRGEDVLALVLDDAGNTFLRPFRRDDGAAGTPAFAGARVPGEPRVALVGDTAFVEHAPGRYVAVDLRPARGASATLVGELRVLPAGREDVWLALLEREGKRALATGRSLWDEELVHLASDDANPDFCAEVPATLVGSVAYVGTRAFDLEGGRVLWRVPLAASGRAVPARDTVLVPVEGTRLVALRHPRSARPEPWPAAPPEGAEPAAAVVRGGAVLADELALEGGTLVHEEAGREEEIPLAEVLAVENADGRLLWAAGREEWVRALGHLAEHELARAYAELAADAVRTNDARLVARLAAEARARGAEGREVERAEAALADLERRPRAPDERRAALLLEREEALARLPVEARWSRLVAQGSELPPLWRVEALRAVLELDPAHAGARAGVRALLPEGAAPPAGFDALDWLDFAVAAARTPVHVLALPSADVPGLTYDQRELGRAATTWRPDVVGFRSAHLLVVTPVERPGAIARALSYGELVCAALGETFAGGAHEREAREPLVLHLFESRDEYVRHSPRGASGDGLAWTAGHYDELANVTRIFVPEGDAELESVLETYAHELTHHWLRVQCPRFPRRTLDDEGARLPGFWVVEGFASLFADFTYDVEEGAWSDARRRTRHDDLVTGAPAEALLPWDELFGTSLEGFHRLSREGRWRAPSSSHLGRAHVVSRASLFYAQSAAACHWLWEAEDGRLRPKLLDYVTAWYTGDAAGLDVERALGLPPADLGARAVEASRGVLHVPAERDSEPGSDF